jgi:arginine deiminase
MNEGLLMDPAVGSKEQLIDELKERNAELMRIHDLLTKEMLDREASEEFMRRYTS